MSALATTTAPRSHEKGRGRFAALFFLTLTLALSSCAPVDDIRKPSYGRDGSTSARSSGGGSGHHIVKKGENLYRISLKYGVPVKALMRANGITDVSKLEVGQKLKIPGKSVASARGKKEPPKRNQKKRGTSGRLPKGSAILAWPLATYSFQSAYGKRGDGKHDGIDLAAPKGTPILAAADGKVIFSGQGPSGYGRIIIIKHIKGLITVYAHNYRNYVREGQKVSQGQEIGAVGNSGRSTGYHLHFEVRHNRQTVDPLDHLPRR